MIITIEDATLVDRAPRYTIADITAADMMALRMALYDASQNVERMIGEGAKATVQQSKLLEYRVKYAELTAVLRSVEVR